MHFPKGVYWGHICASAPVESRHTEVGIVCTALQVEASFLAAAAVSIGALQGQEYTITLCAPCAGHVQALWRQPHTAMGQWPDAACPATPEVVAKRPGPAAHHKAVGGATPSRPQHCL